MRNCAKSGCEGSAHATVLLLYGPKEVLVQDLHGVRDPNHLDLCTDHAARLSPPLGWRITDARGGSD